MPSHTRNFKRGVDKYLAGRQLQTDTTNNLYDTFCVAYTETLLKNRVRIQELKSVLKGLCAVNHLVTALKPFVTVSIEPLPRVNADSQGGDVVVGQLGQQIQHLKRHCDGQIRVLSDTDTQLKHVVNHAYSVQHTSLHPRGLLVTCLMVCLLQLIQTKQYHLARAHPANHTHTRSFYAQCKMLRLMRATVFKFLYQQIHVYTFINYGDEMDNCYRITQKPLTNTYQYGWYHADLAPHILQFIPDDDSRNTQLHTIASSLTRILNNDKSYSNTTTATEAHTFIASECNKTYNLVM